MTFTSFSNDTKKDRNFSKNSKKDGVPKNRLRQNIKKKSELARSNARKQACEDNYSCIPTDTIVVHKHRNDYRKRRDNYSLELYSEEEQNVHQFPLQFQYWWYDFEEDEYYLPEGNGKPRPVEYWSTDEEEDNFGSTRFAENDGWDIDDYQPVGCFGVSHEKKVEDIPLFDEKKVQVSMVVPSAETIKKLDNESMLIAIQKCEISNQRAYEKVIINTLTNEFNKARTELLQEEDYYLVHGMKMPLSRLEMLDRLENNIGIQNRRMVPDTFTEHHFPGYIADWF